MWRQLVWSVLVVAVGCGDDGNHAPELADAVVVTDEDTPGSRTLAPTDRDGDAVTLELGIPEHGTATLVGDRLTYVPAANYHGTDSIAVTLSDGELEATATIEITVKSINDAPIAVADTVAGTEDMAVTVSAATLLGNDTDVDGDPLRLKSVGPAILGTVVMAGTDVIFTPDPNAAGIASFDYVLTDGTADATGTVTVMLAGGEDQPVAVDDDRIGTEDLDLVISGSSLVSNDVDPDGQTLTVTAVANPGHGSVTLNSLTGLVTFKPLPKDYTGPATFDYTVSDGTFTDTATVHITVMPVNDPPVAVADTVLVDEDLDTGIPGATLVANDTDVDGPALTVKSVTAGTHGTVVLAGGVVTFHPTPLEYSGPASFSYVVTDGLIDVSGTVNVTVRPVNDAPVAVDDPGRVTAEDAPLALSSASLVANDTDVDGPALAVTAVASPTHGTVALAGGTATFTPAPDYAGPASFQYTVSDGTLSATGTVFITVSPVNDAPVAVNDPGTTLEDTSLAIPATTLVANDTDVDGPGLSVTAAGSPSHGTVALAGGIATFTPAPDYAGPASFQYTVSDGLLSATGTVVITVTPVNDAPVAVDDTAAVQTDGSIDIPHAALLANDTDVDGPGRTITGVQNAINGTATLGATAVTFAPAPGFAGAASFEYVVSDGTLGDVGRVAVTVVNGPVVCGDGAITLPETCDDGGTVGGDGCSATCQIEPGYACTGEPSACAPSCGDGLVIAPETCDDGAAIGGDGCSAICRTELGYACTGQPSVCATVCGDTIVIAPEQCDDGNAIDADGCTSACVTGVPCRAADFPGGDRFAVDPSTGHCYVSFDDDQQTFAQAEAACVGVGGYLVTITSGAEDAVVHTVQNPAQNPWIGAADDANDTDAIFDWVTDETFGFSHFAPGQPDDDVAFGGNGECLHLVNASSEWNDTSCTINTFVVGRICEVEPVACGDSIAQVFEGEECDDGNTASGDGCTATCQLEDGCGDGNLDAGEQCDDDNTVSGDGCSATCQRELISIAITPGPITISQQQRVQLKATGTFFGGGTADVTALADWTSTNTDAAFVDTGTSKGRVDGLITAGATTIAAKIGAITGTTVVNVNATTCNIRINEIQTHGNGVSAQADEFAELVNPCTVAITVTGWNLVYRSASPPLNANDIAGTSVALTGVMVPGAIRLYTGVAYNGVGVSSGTFGTLANSLAAGGGGMAIRSGPLDTGAIVDSVAWGNATNAFVKVATAPAQPTSPLADRSIYRAPFDGKDSNNNAADFLATDAAATPPTVPTPGSTNFP